MKYAIIYGVVGVAAVGSLAVALTQRAASETRLNILDDQAHSEAVDVDLDEASAIQIAEIVLVKVYGARVLKQRPWNVTKEEGAFTIYGTLKTDWGGVAEIKISRRNVEVTAIGHGK